MKLLIFAHFSDKVCIYRKLVLPLHWSTTLTHSFFLKNRLFSDYHQSKEQPIFFMGCNCKRNFDTYSKYADDFDGYGVKNKRKLSLSSVFKRFPVILTQFTLGVLASVAVVLFVVPLVIYVIICLCFGLHPHVAIKSPKNWFKSKKR